MLAAGPIRPSLTGCFNPAKRSLDGRKKQGLKLVCRQFRKQRLAGWGVGRGPDPSFTDRRQEKARVEASF